MRRIFCLITVLALIVTLCSCKKIKDDVYSSSSQPHLSSEISSVTNQIEQTDVSNTESDDDGSNTTVSTSSENTSSKQEVEDTSKEEQTTESSQKQTAEEKPKEPINFVPKQWPTYNSDYTLNYEDTYISYQNNVFYKGVRYACTSGKNNDVDCSAIVTVGDNDEYLNCVSILDTTNNEHGLFNVYNDRIYYLQYPENDAMDYILLNSFSICSMNLSGEDRRVEKKVDVPFTHISWEGGYNNSKYLYFTMSNLFDGVYDVVYRYNLETSELTNLNHEFGAHKTAYSIGEKIFVWSLDDKAIYQYDVDFNNQKLFFETDINVNLAENGFVLKSSKTEEKFFLDLNGNVSNN